MILPGDLALEMHVHGLAPPGTSCRTRGVCPTYAQKQNLLERGFYVSRKGQYCWYSCNKYVFVVLGCTATLEGA